MNFRAILMLLIGLVGAQSSQATSCMVIGEKSARVQSAEGQKSPYFFTQSCESLRLISGRAMVTWVARDGKPNFAPIASTGPERVPSAGVEERAGDAFWSELTSKRELQRSASMRGFGDPKPAPVYIPVEGLELPLKADLAFRIYALDGDTRSLVLEAPNAARVRLTRELIKPGLTYILDWNHGEGPNKWKVLGQQEMNHIDVQYQEVQRVVSDEAQRLLVIALLYRQLKLSVNADVATSELQSMLQP